MLVPRFSDSDVSSHPFVVHDIDPAKTFVHVLDELTLDILFQEVDTTYDFIRYLRAKEHAIRNGLLAIAPGEEDLLAYYLLKGGLINSSPFELPRELMDEFGAITLLEGFWKDYLQSDQRRLMRSANRVSYFWDAFLEHFAGHIRAGTVAIERDKPAAMHEQAIRLMAAEGRLGRRVLSSLFLEKIEEVPPDRRSSRLCPSPFDPSVCFILILYPRDPGEDYEHYRNERLEIIHEYALVAQLKYPQYKWITLIAMEPKTREGRSEDILAVEAGPLSSEERDLAASLMTEDGILADVTNIRRSDSMAPGYRPSMESRGQMRSGKIGRNEPCPCGSGKKWKRCCGSPI